VPQPIAPSVAYRIDEGGGRRLGEIVANIRRNPGRMIRPNEFDELSGRLDVGGVLRQLPAGMSEDDFIGILKLTMLTECATETFAAAIEGNACRYSAPWLYSFTHDVWTPDELTHATPYKQILLGLGFEEAELDREIRATRARSLDHRSGDTPMHLTTYGMLSEYATDKWHGAIWRILRDPCPSAAYMVARVKRRETFHRVWYRDMTAAQIASNPDLARYVAEVMLTFRMPGASLVPELQKEAGRWLKLMQWDFQHAARELGRMLEEVLGDPGRLGRLLIGVAAERGERFGPLRAQQLLAVLEHLRGAGYSLVGEAFLESVGLDYLVGIENETETGLPATLPVRARNLVRTWLASRIQFDLPAKLTQRETMP
jgi:hypothetical protein